ncbi:MAG: hypothetical protein KDJ14_14110 [Xanthomonadales bacterium]|nr:hypothetical protein [Xanthomonadales bacterium]
MRHLFFVLCLLSLPAVADVPPRFPAGAIWHQRIDSAPLHPSSASMIATLDGLNGWGPVAGVSHRMHIDFSIHVRRMDAMESAPMLPVVEPAPFDYFLPDCEALGTTMPVPNDAAFEGETGQTCDRENADCHLIVERGGLLYELYNGTRSSNELVALCLAIWDLNVIYPAEGRGDHCTSADAAGFPMAPLMPSPDGVQAAIDAGSDSDLGHAIRFVLPNARMASDSGLAGAVNGRLYVRPATHAGGPSGPVGSVPYGVRMRLRADFPMAGYNAAAQVILRTMQRYGIVLSDGGNIALTFASDRHNATTWSALGITPQVFWNGSAGNRTPVRVTDFAVVDTGARIAETYDCVRTDIEPGAALFRDGFEAAAP